MLSQALFDFLAPGVHELHVGSLPVSSHLMTVKNGENSEWCLHNDLQPEVEKTKPIIFTKQFNCGNQDPIFSHVNEAKMQIATYIYIPLGI